jgi:hypothetical protein
MLEDDNRLEILKTKSPENLTQLAEFAVDNEFFMTVLIDGLVAKDNTYRENCFLTLVDVCKLAPEVLYPYWERFTCLLDSQNAFQRAIALQLLARLCVIDRGNKFERLFERYFDLLDDQKIMVSRYLVQNVWLIVVSKPDLKDDVLERLLSIDLTHHPESRKALLKADVIEVLQQVYPELSEQVRILEFVESALNSSSPKARQAAKRFLNKL